MYNNDEEKICKFHHYARGKKGAIYNVADVVIILHVYCCYIDPVFHKRLFDAKIILLIRQRTVYDTEVKVKARGPLVILVTY